MTRKIQTQASLPKLTPQREAVLRVVREREDHPTANEVFQAARGILPGISFATVYNSLRFLREEGLIREISFGDSASRYDGVIDRHDHAICSACGKLVDFQLAEASKIMRSAARKSRFKPESVHLTLIGLCPECREAQQKSSAAVSRIS